MKQQLINGHNNICSLIDCTSAQTCPSKTGVYSFETCPSKTLKHTHIWWRNSRHNLFLRMEVQLSKFLRYILEKNKKYKFWWNILTYDFRMRQHIEPVCWLTFMRQTQSTSRTDRFLQGLIDYCNSLLQTSYLLFFYS